MILKKEIEASFFKKKNSQQASVGDINGGVSRCTLINPSCMCMSNCHMLLIGEHIKVNQIMSALSKMIFIC